MIKVVVGSFLLLGFFVKAQEFQGKAEYFSKRIIKEKVEVKKAEGENDLNPEMEKAFQEAMKKASEKQYLLSFNKSECLYEEQEQLQKPEAPVAGIRVSVVFSGEGKKYLNLKDKKSIEEADIFGKEFLIVEPLEKPDWKLLNETKKIGEYNCFKAELLIQVTEKQKEEYKEFLKKEDFILLSERLSRVKLLCFGEDIAKQWPNNIVNSSYIIEPGILHKDINIEDRYPLIIMSDGSKSSQKICSILNSKYENIKIITSFDDYESVIEQLNKYKVCLNLNTSLDSIASLGCGCITIAKKSINKNILIYNSIEEITKIIDESIISFDIKKQKDISTHIMQKYKYDIFQEKFDQTIDMYLREAFTI